MKKSIFGFILAILLICPFMSQVLRAEARDTDSKVTDADKISYYSFDNISGGLIADEWGSRNAVISGGKISTGKSGSALEVEKNTTGASVSNASVTNDAWTVSYWVYSKALSERSSVLMSSDGKYSFDAAISSSNLKSGVHVGTGSGDVLTFQYTLPAETWAHMTWTQDKTNGLSLYVNGTFVQTKTWTKTNNFPCPADLFGGSGFEGKIDELKIYNRVLTENEILAGTPPISLPVSLTYTAFPGRLRKVLHDMYNSHQICVHKSAYLPQFWSHQDSPMHPAPSPSTPSHHSLRTPDTVL